MEASHLINGQKYIYLPSIENTKGVCTIYFLFSREITSGRISAYQYIFTYNPENISKLPDILSLQKKQEADPLYTSDDLLFIEDIRFIKKYKNRKLLKFNNMYGFFLKHENTYKRLNTWSKIFSDYNPSLFFSSFFESIRKYSYLFRIRYYSIIISYSIIGLLKYLVYPFIYIFDLFGLTFETYINYRKAKSNLSYYSKKNLYSQLAFLGRGAQSFEDDKKNAKIELEKAKNQYLNSNIAILSFSLALIGLLTTQIISFFDNRSNTLQISNMTEQMKLLSKEKDALLLKEILYDSLKTENILLINQINEKQQIIDTLNKNVKQKSVTD